MGKKSLFLALIATVVLGAVAVGGVVLAQTPAPAGPGSGGQPGQPAFGDGGGLRARVDDFLNQLAQNLNIDRSTLNNALKTTANQEIDKAVASGQLSQDQANQMKQRIDSGQLPFGPGAFGAFGGQGHFGRRGSGGPNGDGAFPQAAATCFSTVRDAVPGALGISASDLQQARANGESLAQIAQDHGKTLDDVRSAVQSAAQGCLDQQVQAGNLTQQQEQDILQRLQNGGPFGRRGGQGGGPGGPGQGPSGNGQ
jgi:polyhydroxyalkanoate synthesis regulator phasin